MIYGINKDLMRQTEIFKLIITEEEALKGMQ